MDNTFILKEVYKYIIDNTNLNCIALLSFAFTKLREQILNQKQQLGLLVHQRLEQYEVLLNFLHNQVKFECTVSEKKRLETILNRRLMKINKKYVALSKKQLKTDQKAIMTRLQFRQLAINLQKSDPQVLSPPMCFRINRLQPLYIFQQPSRVINDERKYQLSNQYFDQFSQNATKHLNLSIKSLLKSFLNDGVDYEKNYKQRVNDPMFSDAIELILDEYEQLLSQIEKGKILNLKDMRGILKIVIHFKDVLKKKKSLKTT